MFTQFFFSILAIAQSLVSIHNVDQVSGPQGLSVLIPCQAILLKLTVDVSIEVVSIVTHTHCMQPVGYIVKIITHTHTHTHTACSLWECCGKVSRSIRRDEKKRKEGEREREGE